MFRMSEEAEKEWRSLLATLSPEEVKRFDLADGGHPCVTIFALVRECLYLRRKVETLRKEVLRLKMRATLYKYPPELQEVIERVGSVPCPKGGAVPSHPKCCDGCPFHETTCGLEMQCGQPCYLPAGHVGEHITTCDGDEPGSCQA